MMIAIIGDIIKSRSIPDRQKTQEGLAMVLQQVNQRYASTVGDTAVKLEYDLYYIKNRNLLLDLMIIFKTIGTVLGLKGL